MPKKQRYGGLSSRHDLHNLAHIEDASKPETAADLGDRLDPLSMLAVSNLHSA
jgi:hypothetical protein